MTVKTEVNSIQIPAEYVELCHHWHGGQADMLYAVSSTGGLTTGSIRPNNFTNEEWYHYAWKQLSNSVMHSRMCAQEQGSDDAFLLEEFEQYCDEIVEKLAEEYGLE